MLTLTLSAKHWLILIWSTWRSPDPCATEEAFWEDISPHLFLSAGLIFSVWAWVNSKLCLFASFCCLPSIRDSTCVSISCTTDSSKSHLKLLDDHTDMMLLKGFPCVNIHVIGLHNSPVTASIHKVFKASSEIKLFCHCWPCWFRNIGKETNMDWELISVSHGSSHKYCSWANISSSQIYWNQCACWLANNRNGKDIFEII